MCNIDLRKKWCILPDKLYKEKNTVFVCFKTYVNPLYRSVPSTDGVISYIAQTQHFREFQIFKRSKLKLPLQWICFSKSIFIEVCLLNTSINLISFIRIFAPLLCCHILWSAFYEMFVCVYFCLWFCSCCCCFFLFRFHFWSKFFF